MSGDRFDRLDRFGEPDLADLEHLMPPSVHTLVDCIGAPAALALLNTWPGAEVKVPRFPDANPAGARRWAQLAEVVGEDAMQRLADFYGGDVLAIPLCSRARQEKRNRVIRRDFDQFTTRQPTGFGLSKTDAIREIGMRYAPISARQIESILNRVTS